MQLVFFLPEIQKTTRKPKKMCFYLYFIVFYVFGHVFLHFFSAHINLCFTTLKIKGGNRGNPKGKDLRGVEGYLGCIFANPSLAMFLLCFAMFLLCFCYVLLCFAMFMFLLCFAMFLLCFP